MLSFVMLCRPGFEKNLTQEINVFCEHNGIKIAIETAPDTGLVEIEIVESTKSKSYLLALFSVNSICFARQVFACLAGRITFEGTDRITPIIAQVKQMKNAIFNNIALREVLIECPDTENVAGLKNFCNKFKPLFNKAMQKHKLFSEDEIQPPGRLHVFFKDYEHAFVGVSLAASSSPWPLGIPRLRTLPGAPSRSSLKIEEAIFSLLTPIERERLLQPGFQAVDLGAAPGGWTHQLLNKQLKVIAVDNANLSPNLNGYEGLVHLREDGFVFRPKQQVHWMFCDMIEKPRKVISLVADWLIGKHCKYAIFNLKLPMENKYLEMQKCMALITDRVIGSNIPVKHLTIRVKQLYHDRDEVTCFVSLQNLR